MAIPVPKVAIYGLPGGIEIITEVEMVSRVAATPDIPHVSQLSILHFATIH